MGEAPRCGRDQPSTHVAFPAKVPKHLLEGSYKDHNHIILLFFVNVSLSVCRPNQFWQKGDQRNLRSPREPPPGGRTYPLQRKDLRLKNIKLGKTGVDTTNEVANMAIRLAREYFYWHGEKNVLTNRALALLHIRAHSESSVKIFFNPGLQPTGP